MRLFYVFLQFGLFRKAFSACSTVVRKIIRVGVHVKFQIRHLVECPIAQVASERLFSRMNHYVIAKVPLLVKTFAADVANESFLVTVRA